MKLLERQNFRELISAVCIAIVLAQNITPEEKTGEDFRVVLSSSTKNAAGQTEKAIRASVNFDKTCGIDKFIFILAGYVNSI